MSTQEWRKCYICGEPVLWQTNGIGWHPIQYHDCKPVPGARLEQAERERDELRAEVERLREFENEMTALWKNVMDEKCGTDEVHCSCVPALRHLVSSEKARADKATAERDQLRADVEREKTRADKMKADGERAVMEERNQTAKATAERDRLAGMLARLRHQVGKIMPPRTDCDCSDCLFMRSIDAALAEVGK